MMQCYTELTPPTAVTHSLSLPFISADSTNLIVAKTSLLQIFTTKTILIEPEGILEIDAAKHDEKYDHTINDDGDLETSFLGGGSILRSDRPRRTKLVLIAEYMLAGTITSLARIKIAASQSGGEALLVSFKDAKLSLVEWDPKSSGISTISIHYYEQDDLQNSPWAPNLKHCVNYLLADPGSRCAALKFGPRNLAILPFKQDDEDINMGDWDEQLDGPRPIEKEVSKAPNENPAIHETPYRSSFVLRMPTLDPSLLHPIHLAFLYEYREPTFGILSSTQIPASSLLFERKDHLVYMVFTLDLHQKASTTILSVPGLPYDLTQVIALPAPVGGALLVGSNELIHIDQAGKANGVAVNLFARQCTSFGLVDQTCLEMRLEGCKIEQLSIQSGEMIIILHDGRLAILSFHMDGRSVSGLSIRRVSESCGGKVIPAWASSVSPLGHNTVFIGSECANSIILGWSRKSNQLPYRKSRVDLAEAGDEFFDEEENEDDDADDDLYGDGPLVAAIATNGTSDPGNSKAGDYTFKIHDSLVNIGPITDLTFGKSHILANNTEESGLEQNADKLEIVAALGKQNSGSMAIIHRKIWPNVIGRYEFPEVRGIWTMSVKKPTQKGPETTQEKSAMSGDYGAEAQYDRLMIVSKEVEDGIETSNVYSLTSATFEALMGTEFEPAAGFTIEAGTLGNGMRVIQVLKSEVRSYDGDLGLAQIIPMYDDDTGAEPKIVSASFADPFLLLLRDDSSIFVAHCDDNNELDEIDREHDALLATKWLAGCLYSDSTGVFSSTQSSKGQKFGANVKMFLLSTGGALHVYSLPDLSKAAYVAEGLCFVPPVLSADYAARRSAAKETITEILVADLGDEISTYPYLILRPSNEDLTLYEPFRTECSSSSQPLSSTLHFLKIHNPQLAENPDPSALEPTDASLQARNNPMRVLPNLCGYSSVLLPGSSPSFVIKSSKSKPKVIGLEGPGVRDISSFHTAGCERGFIFADMDGITRVAQLPSNVNFTELGMSLQKVELGADVHAVAYHQPMECYIVATSIGVDFELPKDDDHHREWAREDISFRPTMEQSYLKLINPVNWSVIDTIELDTFESVLCLKTLSLEISEITNERKQLISVGTAICKGEDLATKGRIYVYDVTSVVPEADRPETNKRLKLIAKEDIARGAVTAVTEIGTQGFMLVSQGQKCMVRGLKEDGTLLPVAFMDMNTYVTSIKELRGTGLCVFADMMKGVWFAGYTEEPYKMMLFGKSGHNMEVIAAEILPDGKELYIAVADADCNLHILQYDPEHPKSLHGHLLLHRSTFALGGHFPTTMTLLPRTRSSAILPPSTNVTDTAVAVTNLEHQILMTSKTGCISQLSPLSEAQYRRFSTLTTHLSNTLYHACGLNPKAYRIDRDSPESMAGSRTIVDGTILERWRELGSQRQAEVAGRIGADVDEIREDLLALRSGLGFW